jgi:hypothetical protein
MKKDVFLSITGKASIDGELNPEKEISVAFKRLGIYKTEYTDEDVTYKARNLDIITIVTGDDVIKGKPKKSSQSQVLRFKLRDLWEQQWSSEIEFEPFYQKELSKIIEEVNNKLL